MSVLFHGQRVRTRHPVPVDRGGHVYEDQVLTGRITRLEPDGVRIHVDPNPLTGWWPASPHPKVDYTDLKRDD